MWLIYKKERCNRLKQIQELQQIKEKYQTRLDLLSVSADKYINKMEETRENAGLKAQGNMFCTMKFG